MATYIEGDYLSPLTHETAIATVTYPVQPGDTLIAIVTSYPYPQVVEGHPTGLVGLGANWSRVPGLQHSSYSAWVGVGASGVGEVATSPDSPVLNFDNGERRDMIVYHISGLNPDLAAMVVANTFDEAASPAWTTPINADRLGVFIGFCTQHSSSYNNLVTDPDDGGWLYAQSWAGNFAARVVDEYQLGAYSVGSSAPAGYRAPAALFLPEAVPVQGEFDLKWDQSGDRRYQWGVDRVAYYPLMNWPSAGEVWNGVVSIQEDSDGGEVSSMFYGGEKYGVYLAKEDFVATIAGFYLPLSLERAAGYHSLGSGFIATLQPKEPFDLTYRTFVGDDHFGPEAHYRIHIVYGCMIEPYSTTHKTSTTRPEPGTTSWRIQTLPPYDICSPSATAHYIIDTRYADPEVVAEVEGILYGAPGVPARMPGPDEWAGIFGCGFVVE